MDIDPLADVAPPRHAIESDSEDEPEDMYSNKQTVKKKKDFNLAIMINWSSQTGLFSRTKSKIIILMEPVSNAVASGFELHNWDTVGVVHLGEEKVRISGF